MSKALLSWALLDSSCHSWSRSCPVIMLHLPSSLLLCARSQPLCDLFGPLDLRLLWALWMCLSSWQATDLTWAWVITCLLSHAQEVGYKKNLQTSIFLSTGVELRNDELVFALIYLFFPLPLLFLSFSFLLTLLFLALFFTPFHYLLHNLSASFPSAHHCFSLPSCPLLPHFFHAFPSHLRTCILFLAVHSILISSPVAAC